MKLTIFERWKAPTPDFFKTAIKYLIGIGTICIAVRTYTYSNNIILPFFFNHILEYGIVAGSIGTLLAKLTVDFDKFSS